jgi:hypothetical protein
MREHGVLDRLLLIYEAGTRKFASNEDFDPAIITGSAEIVRDFIGNSHEKSEEEAVFPRFRKVGKMVPLVDTCSRSIKPDAESRNRFCNSRPAVERTGTVGVGC